jgi:hypothetical protein
VAREYIFGNRVLHVSLFSAHSCFVMR